MLTHARLSPRPVRLLPVLIAIALFACRPSEEDTLRIAGVEPLPGSFVTIHSDRAGRLWLGDESSLQRLDGGAVVARLDTPGAPRIELETGTLIVVRSGDRVAAVETETGEEVARREGLGDGPITSDPRGRYLYRAGASGAVLIYDPATLETVSGWPSLGERGAGIAASPVGDRIYLALGDTSEASAAAILTRDIQTGRILETAEMTGPVSDLRVDEAGDLFVLIEEGDEGALLSLRPRGGELRLRWRRTLRELRLDPPLMLRVAADGAHLMLAGGGDRTGLRVLDGETGEEIGRLREPPLDAAFSRDGSLLLLYDREVRSWRPGGS